jgi:hypothetical protein
MTRIDRPDRGTPSRPAKVGVGDKGAPGSGRAPTSGTSTAVRDGGSSGEPPLVAALDRVIQTANDRPGDDRAMLREIMAPTLAAAFGQDAIADPAFFELVDAVVDTLLASPDALRLLAEARAELVRKTT